VCRCWLAFGKHFLPHSRARIATKASAGARKRQAQQKKLRSAVKSQRRRPGFDD
jgi:hypothetical protein